MSGSKTATWATLPSGRMLVREAVSACWVAMSFHAGSPPGRAAARSSSARFIVVSMMTGKRHVPRWSSSPSVSQLLMAWTFGEYRVARLRAAVTTSPAPAPVAVSWSPKLSSTTKPRSWVSVRFTWEAMGAVQRCARAVHAWSPVSSRASHISPGKNPEVQSLTGFVDQVLAPLSTERG